MKTLFRSLEPSGSLVLAMTLLVAAACQGAVPSLGRFLNQTGNAINCQVFGLPGCGQVSLAGQSAFLGVIYAPNALLTLSGTTNAPLEAAGACVARSIRLGGEVSFHYDENLQRIGPIR